MSDIKWIKITTDIFDDEKILLIESLPSGDSVIVIWFKLLCLAGKQNNNGVLMINDRIPYTDSMLASIFRRDLNTVKMALKTFEDFGMIDIIDGVITIPKWEKHQNIQGMDKIREQTRNRVAEHRKRQKNALIGCNDECNVTCNVTVTQSNNEVTQQNKNKNKIKNKNKEKEYNNNYIVEEAETDTDVSIGYGYGMDRVSIPYKEIVDYLNLKSGKRYSASTKQTREHINARFREGYTLDDFKIVIDKKCIEWLDTDWDKYLRPNTLFGPKFESYLNEKPKKKGDNNNNVRSEGSNTTSVETNQSTAGTLEELQEQQLKAFNELCV